MADALQFPGESVPPAERRLHSRQQVRSIAYVELDEGNGGIVLNVSEGGLSVQAVVSLMDEWLPRMRIQLPQPNEWVEAGARIAWTGKSRKIVGVEFVDLPEQARNQIREWISRETLPTPPPRESKAETQENEPVGMMTVASEAAVPLVEPELVAQEPAREDPAQNVSLTTETGANPPVTEAAEATPTQNLGGVPTPTPMPGHTPPTQTVVPSTTPSPPAHPPDQVVARPFYRARFAELTTPGRRPRAVSDAPSRVHSHRTLAALVTLLALLSLATGWAAGRGAFDGLLAKVHAMASHKSAAVRGVESPPAGPIAQAPNVEVADSSNLRSVASAPAPRPVTKRSPLGNPVANRAPQPLQEPMTLQAANSVPTVHRAGYASFDEAPLAATDLRGPASVLPAAKSMDVPISIPPPQVKRQPAVLKPAELIHRVDPVYPAIAREQRIEGTVKLRITIGQDGAVGNVEMLSGPPLLARAATDAVRQWRYSPTMLNGKPVQVHSEVNLVFRLSASSR
jgi:TonB family protein